MSARLASVSRSCGSARFSSIQPRSGAELVAGRLRDQPFNELRLPSLSLWRSYERTGPGVGGRSAVVAPDQM
jgi:hypothetical protein